MQRAPFSLRISSHPIGRSHLGLNRKGWIERMEPLSKALALQAEFLNFILRLHIYDRFHHAYSMFPVHT
jgi:hypothetical protein